MILSSDDLCIQVFFLKIFSLFTFQMLSPFLVSPPKIPYPSSHCSPNLPLPLLVLAFPYTGAYSLLKTKGLSSHWWPTRPSSATYAARDTSSGGILFSSYCCSSYRVADPFCSLGIFSSSFIRDPVFHPIDDSRDCPTQGSISYTTIKPRHYCICQKDFADKTLIQLSLVRLC